ncbi:DNA cytosine methyltransferase [Hungatella hathewayi]
MVKPTLGSLFDGIGGFPLAAVRNGITPVWASEIEAFPIKVTNIRFPDMIHVGDITILNGACLTPVDVICGGSPCQDLSVAGKRRGLAGERSGLFMEQVRIVKEMREASEGGDIPDHLVRPRYLVWENVPGAFSSASGEDFRAVLEEIIRIKDDSCHVPRPDTGRWGPAGAAILGNQFSLAWRVLDAQYWGVAQRRRRIFLVADFGGITAPEILFKQDCLFGNSASGEGKEQGTARSTEESVNNPGGGIIALFENHGIDSRYSGPHAVAPTMSARYGTGGNNVPLIAVESGNCCIPGNIIEREIQNGGSVLRGQQNFSDTLTSRDHQVVYSRQRSDDFIENKVTATQSARQYKDATDLICQSYQETVGTLGYNDYKGINSQYVSEDKCILEKRNLIRRLTPLECERLQGFPDGWTAIPGASDSARYKALGNSVAIPCVDFVLRGIAYFLQKEKQTDR